MVLAEELAALIAIIPLMVLSWLTLYAIPIIMEYRLTAWEAVKLSVDWKKTDLRWNS